MTYSEIKITFNEDMVLNSHVYFDVVYGNEIAYSTKKETWVTTRYYSQQVTLGTQTGTPGERSAINYVESFNLDHNSSNIYEVIRTVNIVVIKLKTPGDYIFRRGEALTIDDIPLNVDFEYIDFTGTIFDITSVEFEQASSNPCSNIKVKVTTSELATEVTSPVVINPNNDNPFYFEALRGVSKQISCENANGQMASQTIVLPPVLSSGNVAVNINNSPNGATVSVNVSLSLGLSLQYSLDDSTWQTSNTFNGLAANNYTLYVKDQYGCKVSKTFVVDEFGIQEPYFLISKANSIRFAERIIWGDCSNYKNDENTLSCEANVKFPYKQIQLFQSCDVVTTQFKSNYADIYANVVKGDNTEVPLIIDKKTNNMRLKDSRDARKFNLSNGKTGIYFINGNIYDYDTGIDTGSDYTLNGTLPVWGITGNYIKIDGAWFEIKDIVFDESRNAEVLVIENTYTGNDTIVKVSCLYNLFNYEVCEFNLNMGEYTNQNIQVKLENNDASFGNITYLSEVINVKNNQENTVCIEYANKSNTDIFYATGIVHKLRLPYEKINGKIEDNSETHKTDTTALLLSSEGFELDEFEFSPITKQLMRKMVQALSHELVFIDGVGYIKNANIEIEGALEDTNLYTVKATMVKTSSAFNQNGDNNNLGIDGDVNIEIPGLIDSGDGYVIY